MRCTIVDKKHGLSAPQQYVIFGCNVILKSLSNSMIQTFPNAYDQGIIEKYYYFFW